MDAYDIANDLSRNPNLLTAGDRLIAFSDAAMQVKDRRGPLGCLYDGMLSYLFDLALRPMMPSGKQQDQCSLLSGAGASGVYLAQELTAIRTTPVKTLKSIRHLGASLNETFCKPVGKAIGEDEVRSILDYLDARFNAKKAILGKRDAILLLPYSHRVFNGECQTLQDSVTGPVRVILFLYHMSEAGVKGGVDPRFVFCHELAHALHAKFINSAIMEVPESFLRAFDECGLSIRDLDREGQADFLADNLAMGMLHESPFADADPYPQVPNEYKALFQNVFQQICENIYLFRPSPSL